MTDAERITQLEQELKKARAVIEAARAWQDACQKRSAFGSADARPREYVELVHQVKETEHTLFAVLSDTTL